MGSDIPTPPFVWDPAKAASNWVKHGVGFSEASSVFFDPLAVAFDDEDHSSDEEDRDYILGQSNGYRFLFVSFVFRERTIRLISARSATVAERLKHEQAIRSQLP